jgi:predicted nucleic acid-binding Zn ribbon protein
MPFYTFQCRTCGLEETKTRNMGDFKEPLCPTCCYNPEAQGKYERMKKVISETGGFKLKGDGWFKDGYSKSEKPK